MANGHVGDLRFGWSEAVQDEVTRDDGGEPANSEHIRQLWEDGVSSKDGGDHEGGEDSCEDSNGEYEPNSMESKIRQSERIQRLPDRYGAYFSHQCFLNCVRVISLLVCFIFLW